MSAVATGIFTLIEDTVSGGSDAKVLDSRVVVKDEKGTEDDVCGPTLLEATWLGDVVAVTVTKTVVVCNCGQLHVGLGMLCNTDCEQFDTVTVAAGASKLAFQGRV